jgi:pimeloyl-ACP methyl ester carboxylesterase
MPKQPLLLIHGALGAAPQLDPLKAALASDFDIHVVELDGHGSTPPSAPRFEMARFVEQVRRYVESRGIAPVAIFGYSMGGYVALLLAADSPALVSRVTTLATKFDWTPEGAMKESARLNPAKIREKVPAFAELLDERHRGAGGWESVLAKTAAMMTELGARSLVDAAVLGKIAQPVRLLIGDKDTVVSVAETSAAAGHLAQGEHVVLENTPHPIEQVSVGTLAGQVRRMLAAALLACCASSAFAQAPPPAPQNPSPMVENSRAHERLAQNPPRGSFRSFKALGDKPVELFAPDRLGSRYEFDLVVHFHGAGWLANQAVSALNNRTAVASLNLGTGSGVYHRTFADSTAFDSLLAQVSREIAAMTGSPARFSRITLTGWSAGHGAIRAILLSPRHFARVNAILLMDGMHTSYVPEGTVMDKGGTLDTTNIVAFRDFARAAMRGEKRFLITHSEIFPGTFASTTETADWLVRALGVKRTPVLKWGPRGLQQLSEVREGRFEIHGYAGNTAPDHVDQLHAMPELLARLLK